MMPPPSRPLDLPVLPIESLLFEVELPAPPCSIGPLNTLFFRFANATGIADSLYPPRASRGNGLLVVGVAGSIFTLLRGLLGDLSVTLEIDAEDVELALECVLLWKLRIELTELDVELRPPSPLGPLLRRLKLDRGVWGCGLRLLRFGGGVDRCVVMYMLEPREFLRMPPPGLPADCELREAEPWLGYG